MSNYWPNGLELSDTQSPLQILATAQEDWKTGSAGVLTLVLQEAKSQSGNDMIIVHAKHVPSNRTATLFSVVHRPNAPYPATIQPKDNDVPNVLKKSYYRPGLGDAAIGIGMTKGRNVTNTWVSDTPSEFRAKLEEVFNLGTVKCEIFSLVSDAPADTADDDEGPTEEQAEES